jgi:hypothetical protein
MIRGAARESKSSKQNGEKIKRNGRGRKPIHSCQLFSFSQGLMEGPTRGGYFNEKSSDGGIEPLCQILHAIVSLS